ncbi:hypothetical protein V6N11_051579 [Hibiscus sabdariffa]|uniref:Uncharacterized protein n=1 Tax=Hibiscus sabdariffa TaxID=183260 RepID=A0ABR2U7K3_9ROSI
MATQTPRKGVRTPRLPRRRSLNPTIGSARFRDMLLLSLNEAFSLLDLSIGLLDHQKPPQPSRYKDREGRDLAAFQEGWDLGGWWLFFNRYCLRKVVCGCCLCKKAEVLKVELERRRSCSISARQCGTILMLKHSGQNLGTLEDKMEKRMRVHPTPTRDPI